LLGQIFRRNSSGHCFLVRWGRVVFHREQDEARRRLILRWRGEEAVVSPTVLSLG